MYLPLEDLVTFDELWVTDRLPALFAKTPAKMKSPEISFQ
jgi:hypothetical protein